MENVAPGVEACNCCVVKSTARRLCYCLF